MSLPTFALILRACTITSAAVIISHTPNHVSFTPTEEFCTKFRRDLELHSAATRTERIDANKLGIAGISLSLIPFVPGIPLGIGAIVLGSRGNTEARRRMFAYGVRSSNWVALNSACANVLKVDPLDDVSFVGRKQTAIDLGIAAVIISLISGILLVVFLTLPENFYCGCIDGSCFRVTWEYCCRHMHVSNACTIY